MNVLLLVNDGDTGQIWLACSGDRFCVHVNAVPPALPEQADMSHISQKDTVVLQVLDQSSRSGLPAPA